MSNRLAVPDSEVQRDFRAAAMFLQQAESAQQSGDEKKCMAALKLVAVALCLREGPNGKIHTTHLERL